MHRAFRWFLYTILTLVAAIWLTLGLIKPEYLRGPLVAWIQQQTGLPLDIGKLNYNPLYPNILLAENVTLGPEIKADKIYLEIASGSWWHRTLRIAHLDIIHPEVKWQPGLKLPQPFQQIDVDDLTIDRLNLTSDIANIENGSLHLKNWQPVTQGDVQPSASLDFQIAADQFSTPHIQLQNTHLTGTFNHQQLKVDDFNGKLLGGTAAGALQWDLTKQSLTFDELHLANLKLDLAALPTLPFPLPAIHAPTVTLENVSAIDLAKHFAVNAIQGTASHVSYSAELGPQFSYQGKLGEFNTGALEFADMEGEGSLSSEQWQLKIKGNAYSGSFTAEMTADRKNAVLTIDELALDKMQTELETGWRERWADIPFKEIDVRRLDINQFNLISFDDSVPLTLKWLNLFLTDLRWTPTGLETSNQKARLEADWLELVWQTLVSRKADLQAELANHQITLEKFNVQLEDSPLTINGVWSLNNEQPHQLKATLKQFDLEQFSDMLGPKYPFAGTADISLDITAKGQTQTDIAQTLSGSASLFAKDLYVDGIKLDPYLDELLTPKAPAAETFEQMTGKLRGGDTFFNHANLQLQAQDGFIHLDGSAFESITHLIALQQGFDLKTNTWQTELALLNDRYLPELFATAKGTGDAPTVSFRLPPKDRKALQTRPIQYPPQGDEGNLRE